MAGGREACFDTICEEWISPRETQQAQPQRPSAITGCTVNCPSILLSGGWLPGKVGTKFMATPDVAGGVTISGLYVCWSLGPKRRRRLVWRNFHQKKEKKKTKQEDRADSDWRPQRSWRFLGTDELRVGEQKEARQGCTWSPSIWKVCPESLDWGLGGVEGLPSREGLSARFSLPALGPRKST